MELITNDSLDSQAVAKLEKGVRINPNNMVTITDPSMVGSMVGQIQDSKMIENMSSPKSIVVSKSFSTSESPWDMPRMSKVLKKMSTVREMAKAGVFTNPKMATGNDVLEDWEVFKDALRIDITVRATARTSIREYLFNIINNPNATPLIKVTELFPKGSLFKENNGSGQAVHQNETRGGQADSIEHILYATGWTWGLLAEIFDGTANLEDITASVLEGFVQKKDDLAISPILNFSYATAAKTAAATGGTDQENLYNTIKNAIKDLGKRKDDVTKDYIKASDLVLMTNSQDMIDIEEIMSGLTTTTIGGQDAPKKMPALKRISKLIEYDDNTVFGRTEDVTYSGVPLGKAYLIKKNRYMAISIKRALEMQIDKNPNVANLTVEQRSYYFVEAMFNLGIGSFIQEITLPA